MEILKISVLFRPPPLFYTFFCCNVSEIDKKSNPPQKLGGRNVFLKKKNFFNKNLKYFTILLSFWVVDRPQPPAKRITQNHNKNVKYLKNKKWGGRKSTKISLKNCEKIKKII